MFTILGWVVSIVFFLLFALSPVVVYLYNRLGFGWCMFISSIFYSLSLIITPFVPNMNFVFLTYSIPSGISTSFLSTLSVVILREYFSKYFGIAISIRYSANAFGAIVLSFTLPFVFDGLGFEHTLLSMLTLTPFILFYGLMVSLRQVTDIQRRNNTEKSMKNIYWEFFQDKSFVLNLAGMAFYMFCCLIPNVFMVSKK